jgi:hypothetical protein
MFSSQDEYNTQLEVSPRAFDSPDNGVVIVGAGLAGMSAAVNFVDSLYSQLETASAPVCKELGVSVADLPKSLSALQSPALQALFNRHPDFHAALNRTALSRVVLLEKEPRAGGNSYVLVADHA